ncbi:MAG: hypothetical protein C0605_02240, partial [Hyphomicrobiales bacterium]
MTKFKFFPWSGSSIKTKIVIGQFVFAIAIGSYLTFVISELMAQQPRLEQSQALSGQVKSDAVPLILAIKDIHFDVVQVQQWLTDISATRGRDGLDDGFKEAENFAARFKADIALAQGHARTLGLSDIETALGEVSSRFPSYYKVGKSMAEAYVGNGPAGGNKMMSAFDEKAAA